MQDRYAGDIGDFGKFALLRALSAGRKLAVCWYLTSGEGERNGDGRHVDYLRDRARFRTIDPKVFDGLDAFRRAVEAGESSRSVAALEGLSLDSLPSGKS